MTRRKSLLAAVSSVMVTVLAAHGGTASASQAKNPAREYAFILSRFDYLVLTTDNAGYRLCLIQGSKSGESMRTSFSGFILSKDSETSLVYDWYEGEETDYHISLAVQKHQDLGARNNRNLNYGAWVMNLRGKGPRFDKLKQMLVEVRASHMWEAEDSMLFRGVVASEEFDEAFLHH